MQSIVISPAVLEKLKSKHNVSAKEVKECFKNLVGTYLSDDREDHRTDPPTLWFVAPTNHDRVLKVVFVYADGNMRIKSAYEPSARVIAIYDRLGK